MVLALIVIFFCKQKTAYELRISDWSSDVCSSDLLRPHWPSFKEILRVGWSAGAISAVEGGLFATISVLLGVIGANALAAGQIAYNCMTVPFMVVYEIGRASCRERVCQYV